MNPSTTPSAATAPKPAPRSPQAPLRPPRVTPGGSFRAHLAATKKGAPGSGMPTPTAAATMALSKGGAEQEVAVRSRGRSQRGFGEGEGARDRDGLASFAVPPAILMAPGVAGPAPSPAAAKAAQHVETAALIERFVTSMRVGRVGKDHAVHMKLKVGGGDGVDVRLSSGGGGVSAVFRANAADRHQVEKLAASLGEAFAARGITLEGIRIESL